MDYRGGAQFIRTLRMAVIEDSAIPDYSHH